MGNYSGRIRCSVCYQTGHNKRSCPTYTERLQKQLENQLIRLKAAQETGLSVDYHQARADELANKIGMRTGTNPLTKEKIVKRTPTRKCSYCKFKHGAWDDAGLGHTRRTCKELKEDKAAMIEANKVYRAGVLANLRANQVGVGALLNVRMSGYFDYEDGTKKWDRRMCVSMVRRIKWDRIACCNTMEDVIVTQRTDKFGTRDGYQVSELPVHQTSDEQGDYRQRFDLQKALNGQDPWGRVGSLLGRWRTHPDSTDYVTVALLAGVPAGTIQPPADWENGASPLIDEYFNQKKQ